MYDFLFYRNYLNSSKETFSILPNTLFDSLLSNDLFDGSVSFTVYLLNPRLKSNVRYAYESNKVNNCPTSLLVNYKSDLQYMLLDLSSMAPQYGSFVPNIGFQMVSYPKLLLQMEGKVVFNPSFVPEIAQIIHQSVSYFLFPDVHTSVISASFRNALGESLLWDFGIVRIEIITIVQELQDNTMDLVMSTIEPTRVSFWKGVLKQLQEIVTTQKRFMLETRILPLSRVPELSLILTESFELLSTNQTGKRSGVFTILRSREFFSLLREHRESIWREFGLDSLQTSLAKETIGKVSVVPVFLYF